MRTVKKGQFYKHFKGHTYIILEMAYDSDKYNEDKNLHLSGMFYDLAFDIEFSETFDPITGMNIEY